MKDFLTFRSMLTPTLIQVIFWFSVAFCVFAALYIMVMKHNFTIGLQILILGPLLLRVVCEMMIVIFRINDNLKTISQELTKASE